MKIIAFMALHYGKVHLPFAIRSLIGSVDEFWIAYTPIGSHGFRVEQPCPDSRAELFDIAARECGDKLRWREGVWPHEGAQRDMIYQWCPDADVILVIDSDEIWPANLPGIVVGGVLSSGARVHRLPMVHFYRDFRHAALTDAACPVRAICPWSKRRSAPEVTLTTPPIVHLGYVIPPELMRYKLSIHGHKGEMRWTPDEYTDTVYRDPNRWRDVHPTSVNYWTPVLTDPAIYMPGLMRQHPYWEKGPVS